jgi:TPP-dependent pyruvate/acetoin dehydrogenase alpha subunit
VGPAADLDVGVQRRGELREWLDLDPVGRCAATLRKMEAAGAGNVEAAIAAEVEAEIAAALAAARAADYPPSERFREHVWHTRAEPNTRAAQENTCAR